MELALIVTADHGPAVSGAHNTIVSARAGKDLVSSLCSGLLTIGPRFGGALNEAEEQFSDEGTLFIVTGQTSKRNFYFIRLDIPRKSLPTKCSDLT